MRKKLSLFFILASSLLYANVDMKQILREKQRALLLASDEDKSQIFYELAICHYQDQEIDLAFSYFLDALKSQKKMPSFDMEQEEAMHYHNAFAHYLAHAGKDPICKAEEFLQTYAEIARQNPHFLHLNFLVATAYANLGKYDEFFHRFYRGYPYLHDTFLAYKTQGILYLRLAHRGKSPEERNHFQAQAFHYLSLSLAQNPEDPSLYKVLIFLAKDEDNQELIRDYLKKIVKNNVILPRSDILFYVKEAAALQEFDLAQAIIDKAMTYYDYSRAIVTAQEYLTRISLKFSENSHTLSPEFVRNTDTQ